ncbi:MAG: PAS domain S-box protein [Polyangiaceae bacterium]
MNSATNQDLANDARASGLVPRLTKAETALRAIATEEAISTGRVRAAPVLDDARTALLEAQEALRGFEARAQAADALESHARRYKKLIDHSSQVIFLCNAEGTIEDVHGPIEQVLGYAGDNQVGRSLFGLVHVDDRQSVAACIDRSGQAAKCSVQYRVLHKNGSFRWLEAVVTNLLDDPDVRSVVFAQRDVSDQVNVGEALRISEARCQAWSDSGPDAVLTLDVERGNFVDVSDSAARLLGYSREQMLTMSVASLGPSHPAGGQSSIDALRRAVDEAMMGGKPSVECSILSASGEDIPIEARLLRFPDRTRQLCRLTAIDLRAHKRSEERRSRSVALDLLARRCSALAGEFAVWARISEAVLRDGDIKDALCSALHACFDAGALCVGVVYLLNEDGVMVPADLGADCGWSVEDVSTFFGQEALLRQTMQWGVSTEIPSAVVPDSLARDFLRRCRGSAAVMVPLRYQTTSLGVCVMVSRARNADREEFRSFTNCVASQVTQVLALAGAFAEKEALRREAADRAHLLRLILDSMAEGVLVADRAGKILLQNKSAFGITAAPGDMADRERPAQLGLYHEDGERLLTLEEMPLVRAVRGEIVDNVEVCHRPPGSTKSTHYRVTARPLTDEAGELQGGVLVIHDVSEQRQAFREVVESRAEWQSLVENAPDFIFKLDLDGVIRFANRLQSGLEMGSVIGTRFGTTVPPEYQATLQRALNECVKRGERTTCEVMGRGTGGSLAWYSLVLGPIRQNGATVGALAVIRDITKTKLVEAQLAESDRMASLGAMATSLAHEINNPLSSLIVNLTLASRDGQIAAAGHHLQKDLLEELSAALDAADRVRQIIFGSAHPRWPRRGPPWFGRRRARFGVYAQAHSQRNSAARQAGQGLREGFSRARRRVEARSGAAESAPERSAGDSRRQRAQSRNPRRASIPNSRAGDRGNQRYRRRHGTRSSGACVRAVLHHQAERCRDWVRARQ